VTRGILVDMDTATDGVVAVTSAAARKIATLAEKDGRPGAALRLRVLAGGCSGFTYELSFADTPAPDDNVVETDGVKVLVDPKSAPIVRGSTLDFDDAMLGGGLKVRNPQAVHECACGDSFSI
jgi:iron-sulfur cluster insertion protein